MRYYSTNTFEWMCHDAFVITDVIKLLWVCAVFIFMDYCVKCVMKLKHQPRFSIRILDSRLSNIAIL